MWIKKWTAILKNDCPLAAMKNLVCTGFNFLIFSRVQRPCLGKTIAGNTTPLEAALTPSGEETFRTD
jgi:hypothetical protein